ncbi:helix-turn-helix domain-containing protein [Aliikangiella sp. G2MR2-5]|uniref:helix-turn-helix domain-containing protein n=1 Tax=Aliikangiella sp. G2MR2-5 TaxID=2788943 RepID=UPI0018A9A98A|nr:helix-turn-helix domain-containing protein [Aliikangiella sp. G2MR2-5]
MIAHLPYALPNVENDQAVNPGMSILIQYLFAIGVFQGTLLAILLNITPKVSVAGRILGVWCFLLALSFLGALTIANKAYTYLGFLVGWVYFLPASFGAMFYLYCQFATIERAFHRKDLLHFLPFIFCYLLNFDALTAPLEVRLRGAPDTISFYVSNAIFYTQAFVYLGLSIRLIHSREQSAAKNLANYNPQVFAWLWKISWLNVIIWTFKLVADFVQPMMVFSRIADALIVIFIYSIALAQWRHPHLFKIAQLKQVLTRRESASSFEAKQQVTRPDAGQSGEDEAGKSGALDAETRKNILAAVECHMHEHKPYLQNQLTLQELAEAVGVSGHHLSETLNQQAGKNFYLYINQYRIDEVCRQLQSDQSKKFIDLALAAGFSSKSTFNAAFKQLTGKTPSQYRAEIRKFDE